MTTGEFEFDSIYVNEQDDVDDGISLAFPVETTIFWVIFVVLMPILFSNLLVSNIYLYCYMLASCGMMVAWVQEICIGLVLTFM